MESCSLDFEDHNFSVCDRHHHANPLATVESDICLNTAEQVLVSPKEAEGLNTTSDSCVKEELTEDLESSLQDDSSVLELKDIFPEACVSNSNCLSVSTQQLVTIGDQQYFLFSVDPDQFVLPAAEYETVVKEEPLAKRSRLDMDDYQFSTVSTSSSSSDLQITIPEQVEVVELSKSKSREKLKKESNFASAVMPGPVDITQAWFTTRDDKDALQTRGNVWKQGQWSKEEVDILQRNIALYCKENNVSDPNVIIFDMNKDERKSFYRTVSKGLNRPLFSVYRRVIRMYDQKNHMGKYTPEEVEKLKELRLQYGTDWARIGHFMGRSAASVKDRCRLLKSCNSGKWLPEEESRLEKAVYHLTGLRPGDSVTSGLSWSVVADHVETRSEKQCRTKWLNYLNWKLRGGDEWTRADDIAIIEKIYKMNVADENEINWEELSATWTSSRSPQWLRGKWWSLKRHIPDFHSLSLPDLVRKMRELIQNQYKQVQQPATVSFYPLSTLTGPHYSNLSFKTRPLTHQTSAHSSLTHRASAHSSCSADVSTSLSATDVFSDEEGLPREVNEGMLCAPAYDHHLTNHGMERDHVLLADAMPQEQIDEEVVFMLEDDSLGT